MKLVLVCCILAACFMVNKAQNIEGAAVTAKQFEPFEPTEISEPSDPWEGQYEVHSTFCDKVQQSISSQICVKSWLFIWSQLCTYECNRQGDVKIIQCCDDSDGEASKYATCSDLQCVKSTLS